MGEGATYVIGAFAGKLDDMKSNLWRKKRRTAWAWLFMQASCTIRRKAFGPFTNVVLC